MGSVGQKFNFPHKLIIQKRQKALNGIAYLTVCQFSRTANSEAVR